MIDFWMRSVVLPNMRWSGRAVNKVPIVLQCRAAQLER